MALLRGFVEGNLYIVAGIALGVAVAQLLGNACSKLNSLLAYKSCILLTLSISNYIFINYFSDMVSKKIRRPNRRSKVTLAPS